MADNADIVRRGYEAFSSGDMAALKSLFAPDAVWHAGGQNRLAGDYKGVDDILGYFGSLMQATGGSLRVGTPELFASGDTVVAISENQAGDDYQARGVNVFTVKGGRVTDVWTAAEDQLGIDQIIGQ